MRCPKTSSSTRTSWMTAIRIFPCRQKFTDDRRRVCCGRTYVAWKLCRSKSHASKRCCCNPLGLSGTALEGGGQQHHHVCDNSERSLVKENFELEISSTWGFFEIATGARLPFSDRPSYEDTGAVQFSDQDFSFLMKHLTPTSFTETSPPTATPAL